MDSFAPAHLVVRSTIEASDDNRAIQVIVDSEDFYRSSTIELEGERAPRTSVVEYGGVPEGEYEVTVRLLGLEGEARAMERRVVKVLELAIEG